MRYEDWDVLLFKEDLTLTEEDTRPPFKEFRTQCQVVYDHEFAYTHGCYGLPTMTCFVPGLDTGAAFCVSVHSWTTPRVSKFTRKTFADHVNLVQWEARIFIDGQLMASALFNSGTKWPQTITHGYDFTKNGDLGKLHFPPFRSEVLQQSHWEPSDTLGRIKILISECFPRDSTSVPTERVKNIVAFSFQHAPLDVLEHTAIAWPNPAMWRTGPMIWSMPVPTEHPRDGTDTHVHSPRRKNGYTSRTTHHDPRNGFLGSMPNTQAFLQATPYADSFPSQSHTNSPAEFDWNSLVPNDLATTLTTSLLNQPIPAPRQASSTNSPPSTRTFSGVFSNRSASGDASFGQSLTNINPVATFVHTEHTGEKIAKRSRHATPASVRALEEEEELKQLTPRVRIGFGQDMAN